MQPLSAVVADVLMQLKLTDVKPEDCRLTLVSTAGSRASCWRGSGLLAPWAHSFGCCSDGVCSRSTRHGLNALTSTFATAVLAMHAEGQGAGPGPAAALCQRWAKRQAGADHRWDPRDSLADGTELSWKLS